MHTTEKNTGKRIERKITTVTFILGLFVLNIIWGAGTLTKKHNEGVNLTREKEMMDNGEKQQIIGSEKLLSHKLKQ